MSCGKTCCSFRGEYESPLVYPWEKRFIESKRENQVFKPYYTYRIGGRVYLVVLYRWVINGECVFLINNQCSIHSSKPYSCKMFPLILNLSDDTLRLSEACPHVTKEYALKKPKEYFKDEYPIAIKSYVMLKILDNYAREQKWALTLGPSLSNGVETVDLDEFIDISNLEDSVEEVLTEVSEK